MSRLAPRLLAIPVLAAALAVGTGCFEGFDHLGTHVVYDPVTHAYAVEQRLTNVSRSFFACVDLPTCEGAIWRALAGEAPGGFDNALADRLSQRLLETGAEDVRVILSRRGDGLDVVARYRTVAGSRAADDTAVRAEWGGKPGKEKYYLVIDHQPEMEMPSGRHTVRRVAGGAGWAESWLLPAGRYDVTVGRAVEAARPLFAEVPGLYERIAGWLDREWVLGEPPPRPGEPPVAVAVAVAVEAPSAPTAPADPVAVAPVSSAPPRADGWPPPDPQSLARVYVFEPRIGGGYPPEQATAAFAPLLPRVTVCWQRTAADKPALQGYLFVDALVRSDGSIVSTSVYGDVADAGLLACMNKAIENWHFEPFGGPQSDVSIPLAVRTEAPPAPPGGRRR